MRVLQMQFYHPFFFRHTDIFACCELRAEVAIGVFDLAPTGFISRCP